MKKMVKSFKVCFCFAAAFLIGVLLSGRAEAAGYQSVGLVDSPRLKVGNYYYGASTYGITSSEYQLKSYIYKYKSKAAKKGTKIAEVKLAGWKTANFLTDGSKLLYFESGETKSTLYSIDMNGKNKKKYATVSGSVAEMYQYKNDQVYYRKRSGNSVSLYSYSTKTKKEKKLVKNVETGELSKSGRHLYLRGGTEKKNYVSVVDCQSSKVIKTFSLDMIMTICGENGKYIYICAWKAEWDKYGNTTSRIYRWAANGSGSPKLIKTIKGGSSCMNKNYIYYSVYGLNSSDNTYYRYDVDKKVTKKISAATFNKYFDAQ